MDIIEQQYKSPDNLNKRIGLYRYSTSEQTFHEWIGTLLPRQRSIRILELGCGTGILWKSLYANYPDCRIVLSDYSKGMIDEARTNLAEMNMEYREIDFHKIPFEENSFDLIISNHNLYHADKLDEVLAEVARVLKSNGTFLCSTNSVNHLQEMKQILRNRGIGSFWPNGDLTGKFGMENGKSILSDYFSTVCPYHFRQKLHITDPEAVVDYLLSVKNEKIVEKVKSDREEIIKEIKGMIKSGLFYEVCTDAGVFLCHL